MNDRKIAHTVADGEGNILPAIGVRMRRRRYQIRLPFRGSRWQGRFETFERAMTEVEKHIAPPFCLDYLSGEDKDDEPDV